MTSPFDGIGAEVADLLDDVATIYRRSGAGATGRFTIVDRQGLACLLAPVSRQNAQTGGQRADLAGQRQLFWLASAYTPPAQFQVEVNGRPERWGLNGPVQPLPSGGNPPELWVAEMVQQTA